MIDIAKTNEFRPIRNPYGAGNPVKTTEMFFGREENFRRVEEWMLNDAPHVLLLIGERRSGKTSILKQIENGRLKHAGEAVFCNFQAIAARIETDDDFSKEIAEVILEHESFQQFKGDFFANETASYSLRLEHLFKQCLDAAPTHRLIMLCDEFESIEDLFKKGILTEKALNWWQSIRYKPVYFVMTSSHGFEDSTVRAMLNVVSQQMPVHELEENDSVALIKNPVKDVLEYDPEAVRLIYRLSGGDPFYNQFICQNLISHINTKVKRYRATIKDIDQAIDFIVENPIGHLQEIWSDPVRHKQQDKTRGELINQIHHTLAALAHCLKDAEEYASTTSILQTAKQKRFEIKDKTELLRTLGWLKKNTRLVERDKEGCYRFRHELLRCWLLHELQFGEDID